MKVRQLQHLVELWKLVEKDPATKTIHLSRVGASIMGMHVAAFRRRDLGLRKGINIDGDMLTGALDLLPGDSTLNIKETDASLVLEAAARRAVLRIQRGSMPVERMFSADPFDATKLREAMPFLKACTAGGVVKPVLNGIHFAKGKLEATDGEVRTGIVPLVLPCEISGQVVSAADLEQALSLLGKKISMKFTKSHLHLRDKETVIKLSLLQGNYPDLSKLPANDTYRHTIAVSKQQLDTAIRAGVLLDGDRIVTLSIKNGKASLVVRGQETGGFREPIGPTKLKDVEIGFDANWLDAAQYIGQKVRLRYNDGRSPVLFTGNKRLLWMSPVVG